jgi:hypothetical protein
MQVGTCAGDGARKICCYLEQIAAAGIDLIKDGALTRCPKEHASVIPM